MNFYDALQLDPSVLKPKIRNSQTRKERWFFFSAMALRSILIVIFAIVFISSLSNIFGKENTPMAVALFCIMLGIRFVNFEYCIQDSLITLALSLGLLLVSPVLVSIVPPILAVIIHFLSFFSILYMTCQRPEFGNGGLYSFAYVYLTGNPVTGNAFIQRALLTLTGYIICAAILWFKHRHSHKEIRFHHIVRKFDLSNVIYRWHLRMAIGVSLVLTVGSFLHVERFMWMGFACASLLSNYPYTSNATERFWQRIFGVVVGSGLFFIIYQIMPASLHSLMGPLGGLCLGFCADYRYKTIMNCFGALMISAELYGVHGAVLLRICNNILGVIFGLCFIFLYDKFVEPKLKPAESPSTSLS